jgi:D-tyrosyl-tRNA(Tyr) deacylase
MKIVIQRVSESSVSIGNNICGKIGKGLLVLVGITSDDTYEDIQWLSKKLVNLRIFSDEKGAMNLSLLDIRASLLVVSQFTLHASTKKGNRPSFIQAAKTDIAEPLYDAFINELKLRTNSNVQSGQFGANMQIHLVNDGPVTLIIDSKNKI